MPWPWPLTFWPQNLISSSLSRDAPVTKVWRKSVNRYWRYRGNIKLPRESRTDAWTTRKHIASASTYRWRRLKIWHGRYVSNMSMNVYAKFCCAPLRIKKALGIFRELIPTTRTRTTRVAFGDPPSGSKKKQLNEYKSYYVTRHSDMLIHPSSVITFVLRCCASLCGYMQGKCDNW